MINPRSSIKVKANMVLDSIDPRIYGQNIEHMGRQVLGGLVAEPGSKAPQDSRGFRLDVLEAIKNLNPPLLRWPGGCFADSYHWSDGIGPNRPKIPNRMWGRLLIGMMFGNPPFPLGPQEDNRFGTDEFMGLCRSVGAEPSITASLGPNDPEEASGWVAYIRDRCGAGAVPTWSVGNEQWSIIEPGGCASRPRKYVERFHKFSKAMRHADPGIKLVASGGDALMFARWNEEIIKGIGEAMDLLSLHLYMPGWSPLRSHVGNSLGITMPSPRGTGVGRADPTDSRKSRTVFSVGSCPSPSTNGISSAPCAGSPDPYQTQREAIGVAGIIHALSPSGEIRENRRYVRHAQCRKHRRSSPLWIRSYIRLYSISCGYTGSFPERREYSPKPNAPLWGAPKLLNLPQRRSFRFLM